MIEAAYGLGEVVVGGQVEPDSYVVAKRGGPDDGPRVVHVRIGSKAEQILRGPDGRDLRVAVPAEARARRVLDDAHLLELARMALRIEQHYGVPQDVEFARRGEELWIVQSRPITTLDETGVIPRLPAWNTLASGSCTPALRAARTSCSQPTLAVVALAPGSKCAT